MSIDRESLTPLPLKFHRDYDGGMPCIALPSGFAVMLSEDDNEHDLAFWLLARQWLDVQVRRGWSVTPFRLNEIGTWSVRDNAGWPLHDDGLDLLAAMQWAVDYDAELTKREV